MSSCLTILGAYKFYNSTCQCTDVIRPFKKCYTPWKLCKLIHKSSATVWWMNSSVPTYVPHSTINFNYWGLPDITIVHVFYWFKHATEPAIWNMYGIKIAGLLWNLNGYCFVKEIAIYKKEMRNQTKQKFKHIERQCYAISTFHYVCF